MSILYVNYRNFRTNQFVKYFCLYIYIYIYIYIIFSWELSDLCIINIFIFHTYKKKKKKKKKHIYLPALKEVLQSKVEGHLLLLSFKARIFVNTVQEISVVQIVHSKLRLT
jgi:hypothetical protein